MSLKWEIKLIGSLCTSLTIEKPWRIVQPFFHLSVKEPPLISPSMKLKHQWSGSDLFTISSTVEISLAFLIWISQVAEHYSPLQSQVPPLLSTENNLHFISWEFKELKKKNNLTGCAKEQNTAQLVWKLLKICKLQFIVHAHRTVTQQR